LLIVSLFPFWYRYCFDLLFIPEYAPTSGFVLVDFNRIHSQFILFESLILQDYTDRGGIGSLAKDDLKLQVPGRTPQASHNFKAPNQLRFNKSVHNGKPKHFSIQDGRPPLIVRQ
jgi:hypothetical protein